MVHTGITHAEPFKQSRARPQGSKHKRLGDRPEGHWADAEGRTARPEQEPRSGHPRSIGRTQRRQGASGQAHAGTAQGNREEGSGEALGKSPLVALRLYATDVFVEIRNVFRILKSTPKIREFGVFPLRVFVCQLFCNLSSATKNFSIVEL